MAEIDGEVLLQEQNRMAHLEQENIQLRNSFLNQSHEINYSRNIIQQPAHSAPPIQKCMNLPTPLRFSGTLSEIYSFKLRLC